MHSPGHQAGVLVDSKHVRGVVDSATIVFEYLTTAITLARDASVVRAIRTQAHASADRVVLAFDTRGPFVHLDGEKVDRCTIELASISVSEEVVIDLGALFAREAAVFRSVSLAQERLGILSEVGTLLRSWSSDADALPRETFSVLAKWQPLAAVESYRQLTFASMALDVERRALIRDAAEGEAEPAALRAYWSLIHLIGNCGLLAAAGSERGWLAAMSAALPDRTWTPSFVLVRERCFRLGLRAGWLAAAFGESVVGRYLDTLRPGVAPLRAFDAVLGLTAVGVRHESAVPSILRDLRSALAAVEASSAEHRGFFEAMRRSAELTLTAAGQRIDPRLRGDEDCAMIEAGLFPCILALGSVLRAPAEALLDPAAARRLKRRAGPAVHDRARAVLLRTAAYPPPSAVRGRPSSAADLN